MFEIVRYSQEREQEWNLFVAQSKNGTFLFDRSYMGYHSHLYCDHSLLFYYQNKLYALLPANESEHTLYTHRYLTYGGLIMGSEATTVHVIDLFKCLNTYLSTQGIQRVIYKAIPWIYHQLPSEEPLYAMHCTCRYRLVERDVSSTIVMRNQLKWKKDRRHGLRLAQDNGISVNQGEDYASFWDILTKNLWEKHGVSPVHSLDEIQLLHNRFPQQIILFEARKDGQMLGGCVVYITKQVVHTQYIAALPEGKRLGVVNAIIDTLLNGTFCEQLYLDFGRSTEVHSDILNENLIYQKEGFGARAVCYDTYEWEL
jgi:hypothetical protein